MQTMTWRRAKATYGLARMARHERLAAAWAAALVLIGGALETKWGHVAGVLVVSAVEFVVLVGFLVVALAALYVVALSMGAIT